MSKQKLPFISRIRKHHSEYLGEFDISEVQCPVCKLWHQYYDEYDLRGIKIHIRKWAAKEAMAHALGEVKSMPHLEFWKQNSEQVKSVPRSREWTL